MKTQTIVDGQCILFDTVVGVTRTDSGELGSTRTDTTTDGRIRVGLGKEHEEKERAQLELTEICSLTDIHLNLDSSACTIQVSANLHHNCCLARLGNGYNTPHVKLYAHYWKKKKKKTL